MATYDEILQNMKQTDIQYNKLSKHKWYSRPLDKYQMDDEVLIFRGIHEWKIVSVKIMSDIGILYSDDKTITYCPRTKTSIAFNHKLQLTQNTYHDNIILKNSDGGIVVQMAENILYSKKTIPLIREEVFRMKFSDTIRKYNDVLFLIADNNGVEVNNDPVVYVFDYVSSDPDQGIKDILFQIDNYRSIIDYINKNESVIREKGTIIIPTTQKAWMNIHPNTIIEKLSNMAN